MDDYFMVNADGLKGAAGKYKEALESYREALTTLETFFNSVSENWTDAAGNQWGPETQEALKKYKKIEETLEKNMQFLNNMATAADTITSEIGAQVPNLYN